MRKSIVFTAEIPETGTTYRQRQALMKIASEISVILQSPCHMTILQIDPSKSGPPRHSGWQAIPPDEIGNPLE